MQGREDKLLRALRSYIADEYRDKRDAEVDTSEWPIRCDVTHTTPVLCTRQTSLPKSYTWLEQQLQNGSVNGA